MDRKIGGCQVKIGASAAMAAAAVTDLLGGNAEDINHAVAFSLMQYEGFPCTAIGDYALTPCILRNAFGAGTAILAGTFPTNHYRDGLSPDAVMEGYIDIARKMDPSLKGAGKAGMAVSQEGLALAERLDRYNKLLKKGGERE
jgi:L-serine dehydratase